ncbi:MAG: cytochrome b N-terminal domain-containing protein [Akkermansiaceae bacterium]
MNRGSKCNRAREWVADRFGLGVIMQASLDRRVAKAPWYYGDGATLTTLLVVLVATGIVMTLTYSPNPDAAYASVQHITHQQTLGWFIRALHYWSAGLMVVMLFFHLFRQILVAGYKFPREATWIFGAFLFHAVTAMSFTGYLLRWDERSIHAVRVMLHMFGHVPWIGDELVVFVQGGEEPGALLLTRIYAVHVIILPLLIGALTAYHIYLVVHHGITSRKEKDQLVHTAEEQKKLYKAQADSEEFGETFYPETMAKSGAMSFVVLGFAVLLAIVAGPAELYEEANLVRRSFPVEEWWFWWYSALIALLPDWLAPTFLVLFPLVLLLAMLALPFVDRGPKRGMRKRPLAVAFVAVCVIALLGLSALRMRSPWTGWPGGDPPPVPAGVILSPGAEEGRLLFARFGCNSCHAVGGHGPAVAVDLARVPALMSRQQYREYILSPPPGIAMPAYKGRLSEEQMNNLLDYVHAAQTFPRRITR